MEEKLKSILKQIHWFLVLRALVFALAWVWLPFWLFALIALYLYLVPLFQAGKLASPFFVLLALSYVQPPSNGFALIFGVLFYFLLLIKDLLLIDRRSAYELLVLALSFLTLRDFYLKFNEGIGGGALGYALLAAAVLALLANSFVRCFWSDDAAKGPRRAAALLLFLLFWQTLIAGLFLPIDFIYQSVAVFLVVVLLIDLIPEYLFGGLSRTKILTAGTVVFGLFVIVLGSARWGL
jgi:hypothetical protein